jgi:nucleotide-binding universal stress UspA family protein
MYSSAHFPRDIDQVCEAVRGMRRSMTGSYLADAVDDEIRVYCHADDGSQFRVDVVDQGGQTRVIQRTPNGDGDVRALGSAPNADAVCQAIADVVDAHGTIVDVDEFEGEGEPWHDEIEAFTDRVDAMLGQVR